LQKILAGESDGDIAESMGIGEPSVRKYIERICYEFGLNNELGDNRRYKRSELVALFAKYKPELLTENQAPFTKEIESDADKYNVNVIEYILNLLSINQPKLENLKQLLNRINLNPQEKKEIAKSLNFIGHKHYLNHDFANAISHLELAIEFNPNHGPAQYNLGSAYEKLDDLERACHHYQIAIRYQNRAADAAINNLARLQILQGKSAEAVTMIEQILPKAKDPMVKLTLHKNLAWAYFQQNYYEQAKQHLLICLELENNYAPAYCLLAQVQAAQGKQQDSIESWQNFLKFYSQDQELKKVSCKLPELEVWKMEATRIVKL
jgi:tetratricopeptide (TPR) repeat protein